MAYNIFKHRRGTTAEWQSIDLIPENGEIVIEECSSGIRKCKIGDGDHKFSQLPYIDDAVRILLLKELNNAIKTLTDQLTDTKAELSADITKVQLEASKNLLETAQALTDDYKASDAAILAELQQEILNITENFHEYTDASIAKASEQLSDQIMAEHEASVEDLVLEIHRLQEELTSTASGITTDFESELTKTKNELTSNLKEHAQTSAQQMSALDDQVTELTNTVENLVETKLTSINDNLDSTKAAVAKISTEHTQDITIIKQDILEKYNVLTTAIENSSAVASNNLATQVENIKADYDTKISLAKDNLTQQIQQETSTRIDSINSLKVTLDSEIDNAKQQMTNAVADLSDRQVANQMDTDKQLEDISKKIVALEDADAKQVTRVSSVNNQLLSEIESVHQDLTNRIDETANKSETGLSGLTTAFNQLQEKHDNLFEAFEGHVESSKAIMAELQANDIQTVSRIASVNNTLTDKLQKHIMEAGDDAQAQGKLISELEDLIRENRLESISADNKLQQQIDSISDNLDEQVKVSLNSVKEQLQAVDTHFEDISEEIKSVNSRVDTVDSRIDAVDSRVDTVNEELTKQDARISNIIAVDQSATEGNTELIDIRSGYDGITYTAAGDAVRAIGTELSELRDGLKQLIHAEAVDGLLYEENLLYLTSKGEIVGEPVEIKGGTGSGGSGGSYSTVKLTNNLESNAISTAKGSHVVLRFTFTSLEDGIPTGAGTCQITVDDVLKQTVTIQQGTNEFDITEHLVVGTNRVKVTCSDQYGISRSLSYTVSVIELSITSSFSSNITYDSTIPFQYTPVGLVDKTIYFYMDDELLYQTNVLASASGKRATYIIPKQTHGVHRLEVFATAILNNQEIQSNHLVYDVICIDRESDNKEALLASVFTTTTVTQGELISIPYQLIDPSTAEALVDLKIYQVVNGERLQYSATTAVTDSTIHYWNTRNYPVGIVIFSISYTYNLYGTETTLSKEFTVEVDKALVQVEPETDSLQLYLSSANRSNNEQNPSQWSYTDSENHEITSNFKNFNWKSNGWLEDEAKDVCLRVNGNSEVEINFKPFEEDFKIYGKTIELEFVVHDVNNRDAVLVNCMEVIRQEIDGQTTVKERGFKLTADTATLKSEATEINCKYKDNEHIRIGFAIDPGDDTRFISLYLNGVVSAVKQYPITDNFKQARPVTIKIGSPEASIDIYAIRVYRKELTARQMVTNYIADMSNASIQMELYKENNIYNELGELSYKQVKQMVPTVTFIGTMPKAKGDKKKLTVKKDEAGNIISTIDERVRMIVEYPDDKYPKYDVLLKQIDVQGTSSAGYVRKNWKVKTEKADKYAPPMLTCGIAEKTFCIKVDYAEATGTHNTQNANYIHTLYSGPVLPQKNQEAGKNIRTTVEGHPIVVFQVNTSDNDFRDNVTVAELEAGRTIDNVPIKVEFSSKGNFNYDKDATDIFGFTDAYDVESWEFCNNFSNDNNFKDHIPCYDSVVALMKNHLETLNGQPTDDELFVIAEDLATTCMLETGIARPEKAKGESDDDFNTRLAEYKAQLLESFTARVEEAKQIIIDFLAEQEAIRRSGKADSVTGEIEDVQLSTYESGYEDDFESRYHPNLEKWEELSDADLVDEANKVSWGMIQRFKKVHDWLVSTSRYAASDAPLPTPYTDNLGMTYNYDTKEYRLAKFRSEFSQWFNMEYALVYYVYTFFALMTDQRAKNMFLTYWHDSDNQGNVLTTGKWYPYFYDNDTCFGINNEGEKVFDYYHEDHDIVEGSKWVFNGQESVLWTNFRDAFAPEIAASYRSLRSTNRLTEEKIYERFITAGSAQWSAAIYNEDAEFKYISLARPDYTGEKTSGFLFEVAGDGESWLRYFIHNRINYCDSKWNAAQYEEDIVTFRIYTPTVPTIPADATPEQRAELEAQIKVVEDSLAAVPVDRKITLTPYSNIYAGVRYGQGSTQLKKRVSKNEIVTFEPTTAVAANDLETYIYGAKYISSLGDLAHLYCGLVDVHNATRLCELRLGSQKPGYCNMNLNQLKFGTDASSALTLLKIVDVSNCPNLKDALDVHYCPNIEEIYAEGSGISTVVLPDSGYVRILKLPKTVSNLTIRNQKFLEELSLENYSQLTTLCIENCSEAIDATDMLEKCLQYKTSDGHFILNRLRLTNINWSFDDVDFLLQLSKIGGYSEDGNDSPYASLYGTCHIKSLTGDEMSQLQQYYPYLKITFDTLTTKVKFMNPDGKTIFKEVDLTGHNSVLPGVDCPITAGEMPVPVRESTAEFDYEWSGWSRLFNSEPQVDALTGISGTRVVYPAYTAIKRQYEITFINPTASTATPISVMTYYGDDAVYPGETPTRQNTPSPEFYEFTGWLPKPEKITGPLVCYAQFAFIDEYWYYISLADISDCTDAHNNIFNGYTLDSANNTMSITKCKNKLNQAVAVPEQLDVDGTVYNITSLAGFENHSKLELFKFHDGITVIGDYAFMGCYNLFEVTLPNNLTSIGYCAFQYCNSLSELFIPASVETIAMAAFACCRGLTQIRVDEHNENYKVIQDCLIDKEKTLIQGLSTGVIPTDGSVTALGSYCFAEQDIEEVTIPDSISTISSNAFSRCVKLHSVTLPTTITTLDATCFAWCKNLAYIDLPEGLVYIKTYVFDSCAFTDVEIPSTARYLLANSFGNMSSLRKVVFKGDKRPLTITENAFINSGDREAAPGDGIEFIVPWSSEDEEAIRISYEGVTDLNGNKKQPPVAPWGARNAKVTFTDRTIIYDYYGQPVELSSEEGE